VICILSGLKFALILKKRDTPYREVDSSLSSTTELSLVLDTTVVSTETES
jgi:hypothetical protein